MAQPSNNVAVQWIGANATPTTEWVVLFEDSKGEKIGTSTNADVAEGVGHVKDHDVARLRFLVERVLRPGVIIGVRITGHVDCIASDDRPLVLCFPLFDDVCALSAERAVVVDVLASPTVDEILEINHSPSSVVACESGL